MPRRSAPLPCGPLSDWQPDELDDVLRVNLTAPVRAHHSPAAGAWRSAGTVLIISSDAAVEHYPGWGGYGASKAALDHLTLTFGVENPDIACYAVDPGDMRTGMQQAAFPGEDISDRRRPAEVVPGSARSDHRPTGERPLPGGRASGGTGSGPGNRRADCGGAGAMTTPLATPTTIIHRAGRSHSDRTTRVPRPGPGRDQAAGRRYRRHHARQVPRSAVVSATRGPAGGQHFGNPGRRGGRPMAQQRTGGRPSGHRSRRRHLGRRIAHRTRR